MTNSVSIKTYAIATAAMALVVVASNILVRYPVAVRLGPIDLADLLTYGAFTYPAAFLVTDITNRSFGARSARIVVLLGFGFAVVISAALSSPRIALASAAAFLIGQLLDIGVFNRLRRSMAWWRAPFAASTLGSLIDTAVFFTLAFAPVLDPLALRFDAQGASDAFAVASAPLFGMAAIEAPRWLSWALADFSVKLVFAIGLLAPYRVLMALIRPGAPVAAEA